MPRWHSGPLSGGLGRGIRRESEEESFEWLQVRLVVHQRNILFLLSPKGAAPEETGLERREGCRLNSRETLTASLGGKRAGRPLGETCILPSDSPAPLLTNRKAMGTWPQKTLWNSPALAGEGESSVEQWPLVWGNFPTSRILTRPVPDVCGLADIAEKPR